MTPYSTFGEIPRNSRGDEPVECALDISCPLAEMSQPEANLTRMAAGGFTVSMYDTIQRAAQAEEAERDSRWVGRVNYEEVAVENNRVMLVGSLDVEYKQGANKRAAVSVEGVEFDWEPDAHFLALEISNLAKAAKPAKMSTEGTPNATTDQSKTGSFVRRAQSQRLVLCHARARARKYHLDLWTRAHSKKRAA